MTRAQRTLFNRHLQWATEIARWYKRQSGNPMPIADLEAAAQEGLLEAALRYNRERNFQGFARNRVVGAMRDFSRMMTPCRSRTGPRSGVVRHTMSLEEMIEELRHVAPGPSDALMDTDGAISVLRPLPPLPRMVVWAHVVYGVSLPLLAARMGYTPKSVREMYQASLASLRRKGRA